VSGHLIRLKEEVYRLQRLQPQPFHEVCNVDLAVLDEKLTYALFFFHVPGMPFFIIILSEYPAFGYTRCHEDTCISDFSGR
jgi:hypothetical protein